MLSLTLKVPELYVLYLYYVVHICDFGTLRVKCPFISFELFAQENQAFLGQKNLCGYAIFSSALCISFPEES